LKNDYVTYFNIEVPVQNLTYAQRFSTQAGMLWGQQLIIMDPKVNCYNLNKNLLVSFV